MKLLRSVFSLISKNTRNELHSTQQSRLFCTTKSGNKNENKIDDKSISPSSASNDEDRVAYNKRSPVDQEDSNLSNVEKGIFITSYSTVSTSLVFPLALIDWRWFISGRFSIKPTITSDRTDYIVPASRTRMAY